MVSWELRYCALKLCQNIAKPRRPGKSRKTRKFEPGRGARVSRLLELRQARKAARESQKQAAHKRTSACVARWQSDSVKIAKDHTKKASLAGPESQRAEEGL